MEIQEALARCLRALETEPEELVALARRLAAKADEHEGAIPSRSTALERDPKREKVNRAVLQSSQALLVETLSQLHEGNS